MDISKIELSIPIMTDGINKNNCIFTRESMINATNNIENLPIVIEVKNDEGKYMNFVSGNVIDGEYSDDKVKISGNLFSCNMEYEILESHETEDNIIVIDEFKISGININNHWFNNKD